MRDIPLAAILQTVADQCGVSVAQMRLEAGDAAREARRVYCYLARGLTQADFVEIGALVIEDAAEVEAAIEDVAGRLSRLRDFAELVAAAEIEIRALALLSVTRGFPLPTTAPPEATALRLVRSQREATGVSIGDLAALGAAYLASRRAAAQPPASEFMRAAAAFDKADREAATLRFTAQERGALITRDRTLKSLLSHLGAEHVESI